MYPHNSALFLPDLVGLRQLEIRAIYLVKEEGLQLLMISLSVFLSEGEKA